MRLFPWSFPLFFHSKKRKKPILKIENVIRIVNKTFLPKQSKKTKEKKSMKGEELENRTQNCRIEKAVKINLH